ncbi:MAG: DNA-deoxyinosine glycosylase [Campylobacteraceae bacterium]|jgi:hypoxanthine-DNA glycosylase|nr:DNA-deoxyinosine glycosylase [Campylobacteraceae bacterium]
MNKKTILTHPFECIFDKHSKVLILGSFPSPKSRQNGFYYGHSANIFWKILPLIIGKNEQLSDEKSKKTFLLRNHIAVWDVLHSCEIKGADDSTIRNPIPNDFSDIFERAQIKAVFTTGKKATTLFEKLCAEKVGLNPIYLPSTSPANVRLHKSADFLERWKLVATALKDI